MTKLLSVCVGSIRGDVLPELVESITRQTVPHWELIVAAQGEDPGLYSYLERKSREDRRIKYVRLSKFGRSHALNEAARRAEGEILAFTDDDCTAAPDWLEHIEYAFSVEPSVGIIGGDTIASPRRRLALSACPATATIECIYRPAEAGFRAPLGFYFGGANLAARREVFDKIGGFDEVLGVGACFPAAEDVDFGLRAEALGVVMWTRPRIIVHHTHGRRYGLKRVLDLCRGSAIGCGALGGKLQLWGHRLSKDDEWSHQASPRSRMAKLVTSPARSLFDAFRGHYVKIGAEQYLSRFEIDERRLSRPKPPPRDAPH